MKKDVRKSERLSDFVPVDVFISHREYSQTEAGPFKGSIVDICHEGACLLMSHVQIDTSHVYHSLKNNEALFLELVIHAPPLTNLKISARPVWINTYESPDFQERMIGIEFINKNESENINSVLNNQ
jgi:hypothetical protein